MVTHELLYAIDLIYCQEEARSGCGIMKEHYAPFRPRSKV